MEKHEAINQNGSNKFKFFSLPFCKVLNLRLMNVYKRTSIKIEIKKDPHTKKSWSLYNIIKDKKNNKQDSVPFSFQSI